MMNLCTESELSTSSCTEGWVLGAVARGLAPAVFLWEPWGVSQNLILWEPLAWQGIPAEKWRPHPCHGHSRGPPLLELQQQQGNTHASVLPTLGGQRVTGPWANGQSVLGHILAGCKWLLVQFREVTSCGSSVASCGTRDRLWYRAKGCFAVSFTTQRSQIPRDVIHSLFEAVHVTLRTVFVPTWSPTISSACKCGLRSLDHSVLLCT